jgi:hypothetical protein
VQASTLIADSTAVDLEAVSPLRPFDMLIREISPAPSPDGGLRPVSSPFTLDFPVDAVERSIRLRCDPGERTGLFEWSEGRGWSCVGIPSRENGSVLIARPGTYAFLADRLPPELGQVSLEPTPSGGSFYRSSYCAVPVREEGSGVDPWSASAELDGIWVVCEWDEHRGRLVIPIPSSMPPGRKTLAVEVSDRAGNVSAGQFGFMLE